MPLARMFAEVWKNGVCACVCVCVHGGGVSMRWCSELEIEVYGGVAERLSYALSR